MRLVCFLASLLAAICASAQDYPSRPVKIIVSFPAGGASDIVARVFAERLSDLWKQQVIVENRIGGGGSIGTEAAFRADPDGYTVLLASSTQVINQVLIPQLPFTFTRDFPALGVFSVAPMMIAVHPSVPASNLKELTAMLKGAPGRHDYTACNMASPYHFAMEMYKQAMGVYAVHIPHRGCSPASADAAAGHIKIVIANLPAELPFVRQGRLRPIALVSRERSPAVPDVPTMRESGLPELKDFYLESYYGFMATPRTPAPIVAKLEADMLTVSSRPELRKRLEGAGLDMMVLNSTAMMNLMRADAEKYARTAKQAGIKVE
jgi:tripartite-type tricarboxylate transporter receptor subunit TctC